MPDRDSATAWAAAWQQKETLRTPTRQIKHQVFGSFDLHLAYEKREGRVETSATVSEAVAEALENSKTLLAEGSSVVATNMAGARFVSRHHPPIVERI